MVVVDVVLLVEKVKSNSKMVSIKILPINGSYTQIGPIYFKHSLYYIPKLPFISPAAVT